MLADYNIDFNKLIKQYLKSYNRTPIRISWLTAITSHLNVLQTSFISHFNDVKDEMKWVGQTVTLERFLQIKFGILGLKIINNDLSRESLIGYPVPNGENPIAYSATDQRSPIGYDAEMGLEEFGFKIEIPAGSIYNPEEMIAQVRKYLIGASNFEIVEV